MRIGHTEGRGEIRLPGSVESLPLREKHCHDFKHSAILRIGGLLCL
jgi:hypothetical protein